MNVKFFMNTKLRHMTTIFALTFLATACACAQSARNNPAGLMFRDRVEPHWLADATGETNGFWYRVNLPENRREFILVNALAGRREPAFDQARVAKALSQILGHQVNSEHLPVENGFNRRSEERRVG